MFLQRFARGTASQCCQLRISAAQPATTQNLKLLLQWNLGVVGNKWYWTGKASMQIVFQVTEIIVTIKTRWRSYKKEHIFSVYYFSVYNFYSIFCSLMLLLLILFLYIFVLHCLYMRQRKCNRMFIYSTAVDYYQPIRPSHPLYVVKSDRSKYLTRLVHLLVNS
jgi:hypothetical protein